jgi:alkyldihydroxyacetonephosphate synthase
VVGSEGTLGVLTEVTVRVRPLPTVRRYEGFVFDGWSRGAAVVRELAQHRVLADVTRLSDPNETEMAFALSGGWKTALVQRYLRLRGMVTPCLLILGWEGASKAEVAARRKATLRVLRDLKPVSLGTAVGEKWRHGRFAGPRQRDALMDLGVCVETLETATYWSTVDTLRSVVRAALQESLAEQGVLPLVACHISHAYETGASLYFTAIVPRDLADPIGQWQQAKAAACAAISSNGPLGTISHHHAVGVDHAPYLPAEIGTLGVDVLAAVKRELDPDGVLNPGKLVPRQTD